MDMKWLHEEINEELEGAEGYAKKAMKMKERGKTEYASILSKMAEQEMEHADHLLKICEDKVAKQDIDVHHEVWKYMKECIDEEYAEVKAYLMMLK